MSEYSTCKICSEDYLTEDMIEDIQGALYCLVDSGDICPNCGIYGHQCEFTYRHECERVPYCGDCLTPLTECAHGGTR